MFHMMTFIFPSFLIALSLNIPKWLEFEHITRCHYNLPALDNKLCTLSLSQENITLPHGDLEQIQVLDYGITELRSNQNYVFYYTQLTR